LKILIFDTVLNYHFSQATTFFFGGVCYISSIIKMAASSEIWERVQEFIETDDWSANIDFLDESFEEDVVFKVEEEDLNSKLLDNLDSVSLLNHYNYSPQLIDNNSLNNTVNLNLSFGVNKKPPPALSSINSGNRSFMSLDKSKVSRCF